MQINDKNNTDAARCFIGLGSNIQPREGYLRKAVHSLEPEGKILKISSVYETAPVGGVPQPDYLNAVLEFHTRLGPLELVHRLKTLEHSLGRTPRPRWHEREIDLDLLFYDTLVLEDPDVTLPHPEIPRRAFVLVPMAEIAPDFVHPILQKTMRELRDAVDSSEIHKIDLILEP